jgi:ligand-binding SRPBCC domain-containing protein
MPLIELETRIAAPQDRVFDLARSIDAHLASAHGTNERAIAGRTSGLIEQGETVTWEARHLGMTQQLTVRITAMNRPHSFEDEMVRGAFASMRHIHRFLPHGTGTIMRDEFQFAAPLGILGRTAEHAFLTRYMRTFLEKRALALKALAESNDWQRFLPATFSTEARH